MSSSRSVRPATSIPKERGSVSEAIPLAARSALAGVARPGRFGNPDGEPGVTLAERSGIGLATVAARKGQAAALREQVLSVYGVALPDGARLAAGPDVSFIGTGPGQWLAVSGRMAHGALAGDLAATLKGLASVSDQSDGRAILRISGSRARDVLAKGLPIDLHPSVFGPGSAATSVIALMGVTLWQVDDAPTYDLAVFRSLAGSFWTWLTDSAAEFGCRVEAAAD
jgi:sarcosine oxidase subunit gamma